MNQVLLFSVFLISGIALSQVLDLQSFRAMITTVTMICLAYIMIEVGLEFTIDKKNLKSYGLDYLIAATAATFPWILCALYFVFIFGENWTEALLTSRFAAPTSAGILFTMLTAAGLATTWVFKKARILAIFDDLDTVLFMIPLKMLIVGLKPELIWIIIIIVALICAGYQWLHSWKIPTNKYSLAFYAIIVALSCELFFHVVDVHLEVLLPAFILGCVIFSHHKPGHEHEQISKKEKVLDKTIKLMFMFLVGLSLPKVDLATLPIKIVVMHVLILTILSNLGKCFPLFCYSKEASLKERLALSIAMFPRGEVGAGVLLVSIGYGITGLPITVATLSLALNLLLTGVFITVIMKLIKTKPVL